MDRDKFEILKMLTDLAENESDRCWARFHMLLLVNTGLVAALSFSLTGASRLLAVGLSLLGITCSWAWLKINVLSDYYEHRWYADVDEVIKSDETLSEWVRGRIQPRIPKPFRNRGGWFYFNMVPKAFLILWVLVLAVVGIAGVCDLVKEALRIVGQVFGMI